MKAVAESITVAHLVVIVTRKHYAQLPAQNVMTATNPGTEAAKAVAVTISNR
jgi:hypothetical protein